MCCVAAPLQGRFVLRVENQRRVYIHAVLVSCLYFGTETYTAFGSSAVSNIT